jgi:hypothetical protein
MWNGNPVLSIDESLRERLMPVEGAIPHILEMFGNSGIRLPQELWSATFLSRSIFNNVTTSTRGFARLNAFQRSVSNRFLHAPWSVILSTTMCRRNPSRRRVSFCEFRASSTACVFGGVSQVHEHQ